MQAFLTLFTFSDLLIPFVSRYTKYNDDSQLLGGADEEEEIKGAFF